MHALSTDRVSEPPPKHFALGLRMALNLKSLSFYSWLQVRDWKVTQLVGWLLQELHQPGRMPLRAAEASQCSSNLATISVRMPVESSNSLTPPMAGALSEMFLDKSQYPMLKDVLIRLVIQGEDSGAEQRKEVELAMQPSMEKGILRLLWQ
jgi:hypothetical protein